MRTAAAEKSNSIDMTHGRMWDKILRFAFPLALSGILQQLFNAADTAVVGQFAGASALAAVGANAQLINLLINLFVGLSIGSNVVISNYMGRGDSAGTGTAVHTSILLSLLSGLLLTVIGVSLARPLLWITAVPDDVIDDAALYLRIYFAGMPFMMLYNFEAAIMRSSGDTRRPLIVLFLSGAVNLLMNLFFVLILKMTVDGVALATVISNILSSLILLRMLMKEEGDTRVVLSRLRLDRGMLTQIAKIGIPAGLQSITFSLSNVVIQSSVNSLGTLVIAGNTAGHNCDSFTYYILNSFSQAAVSFIGQNRGAGNPERCRTAGRLCIGMGMAVTAVVSALEILLRYPIVSLFTNEEAVQAVAAERVVYAISFQFLNGANDQISGCMRGLGLSLKPANICIISICGTRLLWVFFIFPLNPTYGWLLTVYPISWLITLIPLSIAYRKALNRMFEKYRSGSAVPQN